MKLAELLNTVFYSAVDDWFHINSSPTYHDAFVLNGSGGLIEVNPHHETAIYKQNISITLAWGRIANANFKAPWTKNFYDAGASTEHVELFYNNSLMFRELYALVDKKQLYAPIPNSRLEVPANYCRLVALLAALSDPLRNADFYANFERAGFSEVDEFWPAGIYGGKAFPGLSRGIKRPAAAQTL